MAALWIVCGARRGVGKTTVARGLAALLPDADCAKLGSARAKLGKPGNYFRDLADLQAFVARQQARRHLVLELHRTLHRAFAGILVFVEAPDAGPDPELEAVRAAAAVIIGGGQEERDWQRALRHRLDDAGLRARVCRLFAHQQEHLRRPCLEPRLELRIVRRGQPLLTPATALLLERLAAGDDLAAAAAACAISRDHARRVLRRLEARWERPLLTAEGLAPEARHLLAIHRQLTAEAGELIARRFAELQPPA